MKREQIIEDMPDEDDFDYASLLRDYAKTDDLIPAPILIRAAAQIVKPKKKPICGCGYCNH